ncbi:MAG: Omp28-related outer membrane protein, partial [Bacteroidetes bacterium]|nr:Omp28-related outer membrane protein [Bacteroidota bacterium]
MKKITIYIFIFYLILSSLYAQTPKWVSTEVQTRGAVIELFTSIYRRDAYLGEKIVDQEGLEKYPGKVIVINNHCDPLADSLAMPNQPDLRTDEGCVIYNRGKGIPFPGGSINRSVFNPWIVDYYSCSVNIPQKVKVHTSVVNVYIKPDIDVNTRELTVEVEYYYTGDSPASENYLTVMLLQNNIICYQEYGSMYPKNVREDSLYCHNYVLRKILSDGGAWGDPITTTTKGSYGLRKYTTILPDSIRNVPLDITNLEVVAFISEADSNIYTGHRAVVEIPEDIRTDLTIEDLTEYHNTYKFETIHPKVKVTNKSVLPVTKFDAVYTLTNSQNVVSKKETYLGLLNKDESAILEFPEITNSDLRVGSKYIAEASVESIFSDDKELIDSNKTDNKTKTTKMGLLENAFDKTQLTFEQSNPVLYEEFVPPHTIFDNTLNPHFKIFTGACGAKNTANGVLFYLYESWNVANKPGYIMFGEVDCQE